MEKSKQHSESACFLRCDLHTHSVFSDGTYTPGELVAQAKRLGLIVALTDHNTVAGLPEFMDAAQKLGVTAVPGVEFSTEHKGKELHLLGLFVFPEHYAAVERMVKEQHVLKEISNMELVERLNQAGYLIDYAKVKGRNPNGNANRAHVAAELLEQGYVTSVREAFDTILSDRGGFYVPPSRLQLMDVIKELRRIGVLPVLAHPLQELTEAELRALLPSAIEAGLIGMETMHSSYTPETISLAEAIAQEHHLLSSGGSDFHGSVKPEISLGTGRGWLCIPEKIYLQLLCVWRSSHSWADSACLNQKVL
ncbi:MAG: PHP domain-containing protein [Oscillospiraceae bacterium]|nr:PHP domain-containing protein [Oscillospiraceae bacterium]